MMRPSPTVAIAATLIALSLGACESFTSKRTYSLLPDQVFYTRGASEARLGSWGIEDEAGIDSFERLGWHRDLVEGHRSYYVRAVMAVTEVTKDSFKAGAKAPVELKPAGSLKADREAGRVFALAIVDLNKDHTIWHLNQPEFHEVRERLRRSDASRIITSVAVLVGEYRETRSGSLELEASAEAIADIVEGEIAFARSRSTSTTIQPGSIYAYQMSKIGWSESGERITILKTDRPWVRDSFYDLGVPASRTN